MTDHSKPSQYDSKRPGGLDNMIIALVGLIGAALFVVLFVATETWFDNQRNRLVEEGYRRGNPQLEAYYSKQEARLSALNRIRGDAEHATVPIDLAIDRFIEEHSNPTP